MENLIQSLREGFPSLKPGMQVSKITPSNYFLHDLNIRYYKPNRNIHFNNPLIQDRIFILQNALKKVKMGNPLTAAELQALYFQVLEFKNDKKYRISSNNDEEAKSDKSIPISVLHNLQQIIEKSIENKEKEDRLLKEMKKRKSRLPFLNSRLNQKMKILFFDKNYDFFSNEKVKGTLRETPYCNYFIFKAQTKQEFQEEDNQQNEEHKLHMKKRKSSVEDENFINFDNRYESKKANNRFQININQKSISQKRISPKRSPLRKSSLMLNELINNLIQKTQSINSPKRSSKKEGNAFFPESPKIINPLNENSMKTTFNFRKSSMNGLSSKTLSNFFHNTNKSLHIPFKSLVNIIKPYEKLSIISEKINFKANQFGRQNRDNIIERFGDPFHIRKKEAYTNFIFRKLMKNDFSVSEAFNDKEKFRKTFPNRDKEKNPHRLEILDKFISQKIYENTKKSLL